MPKPRALDDIVAGAPGKMLVRRMRARQVEMAGAARGPAMDHLRGHVGMKLKAEGVARAKCLHRKIIPHRQQFGPTGKLESFAVPVIDLLGPIGAELQDRKST